ncbi:O-methyltransferase [Kosakonia cowanii]|jgi:predicted O-methyltransferase YrrM|uniref:O-methyltransferase n=1 Tax=Kosakonia cowanii TaxID=208223 RepID=UPI002896EE42|nr:O-methyltransferase [Kosakonia cowanii]WPG18970.1 O-methyltransferase [Kosakonia cowanii]WRY59649.1 O-methyltransferase [Kosakonia cowanii]
MQQKWSAVDEYLAQQLLPDDEVLTQILANNRRAGLPEIDVSPMQGQLLALLVRMTHAKRILEIGTLGAYSTVWMARELPSDGELLTLEFDALHAAIARENVEFAGLTRQVKVKEGPALETLESLGERPPFDLIFIDADKPNNPNYLKWALHYSRPGTLIIGDNVVRDGEVTNPSSTDDRVQGVRKFIEMIGDNPRLTATAMQTVGTKGWDGFTLAWVNS